MTVTASMISNLRQATGAGIAACKKALEHAEGNHDAAVDYLRTQNAGRLVKLAARTSTEGMVFAVTDGAYGALVEINAETDFASKSDVFVMLVEDIKTILMAHQPETLEELMEIEDVSPVEAVDESLTVNDLITRAQARMGERIVIRRLTAFSR